MNYNNLKNLLPHNFYRYLSNTNRIQFWIVSIGCFVSIITFWFGIALQYISVDYNRAQNERLSHMQLIDKLYPLYKEYNDSCRAVYEDNLKMILRKREKEPNFMPKEWINNYQSILKAAKKSVGLSSKAQYYFDEETHNKIRHNNTVILLSLKTIELYKYQLNEFQFKDSIWSFIRSNEYGFQIINTYGKSFGYSSSILNDSHILALYRKGKKMVICNTAEFALMVFNESIMPHLRKNAEIMSEELVHASYKESESPITYVLFSLLIVIIIGVFLWLLIINIVFDKNKIIVRNEQVDEFEKLLFQKNNLQNEINLYTDNMKKVEAQIAAECKLIDKNRTTLVTLLKENNCYNLPMDGIM